MTDCLPITLTPLFQTPDESGCGLFTLYMPQERTPDMRPTFKFLDPVGLYDSNDIAEPDLYNKGRSYLVFYLQLISGG